MKAIKILFILFAFILTLTAKVIPTLPVLLEQGELFDEETFKQNFYIDKASLVTSVAISADGATIVSGSWDDSIR